MYVSWGVGLSRPGPCGMRIYDADGHVSVAVAHSRMMCYCMTGNVHVSLTCGWSGLNGGLCLGAVVWFVTWSPLACVRLVACYLVFHLLCVSYFIPVV